MNSFFLIRRSLICHSMWTFRINMNGAGVSLMTTDDFGNLAFSNESQLRISFHE